MVTELCKLAALEALIARGIVLRLTVTKRTPTNTDTMREYEELSILGYTSALLDPTKFKYSLASGAEPTRAVYKEEVIWKFNGYGPIVHASYLTSSTGGALYTVEPFAKPLELVNRGDVIAVTPILRWPLPPAVKEATHGRR